MRPAVTNFDESSTIFFFAIYNFIQKAFFLHFNKLIYPKGFLFSFQQIDLFEFKKNCDKWFDCIWFDEMPAEGLLNVKCTTSLQFAYVISYKKKKLLQFLKRIPLVYHSRVEKHKKKNEIDHTPWNLYLDLIKMIYFLHWNILLFWLEQGK